MRAIFVLGFLCLVAIASAAKQEKDYSHHNVKKYEKEPHYHHHKRHKTPETVEGKKYGKWDQSKKDKTVAKNAPHETAPVEAELQSNLKTSHKQLKSQHERHHQQDMHLQDLAYEEHQGTNNRQEEKQPHEHQKNHHKNGQHSSSRKGSKEGKVSEKAEEGLLLAAKDNSPKAHPVLEDGFEPLYDGNLHHEAESKKHSKKQKHKKAHEKSKKDKHHKKSKKDKKHKKEKKEKKSW